jgi:two-component system, NarL family, nitrate/nitrite response regulator NarL
MNARSADAPLRVALRARSPERRDTLARLLREAGFGIADPAGDADAALIDVAPGERVPDEGLPSVVLSDSSTLARDLEIEAVLPRAASPAQIDAALRAASAGLLVRARDRPPVPGFSPAEEDFPPLLTPREVEILAAIGEGLSNKEIARRLGISAHTVKFHLEAIFAKLQAGTRAEAVAKGLRRGLIEA